MKSPSSEKAMISSIRCLDLGPRHAVQSGAEVDVLASGELAAEAGGELDQRRHSARRSPRTLDAAG